jgi:hypothetical protein
VEEDDVLLDSDMSPISAIKVWLLLLHFSFLLLRASLLLVGLLTPRYLVCSLSCRPP